MKSIYRYMNGDREININTGRAGVDTLRSALLKAWASEQDHDGTTTITHLGLSIPDNSSRPIRRES